MRSGILGGLALIGGSWACGESAQPPPFMAIEEVDVFIGTGGLGFGVGSMTPGPQRPFSMARPGPDTATRGGAPAFSHCAGYWYEDPEIITFSQLRLVGTGVPDLGVIGLMPVGALDGERVRPADYRADYDHRLESASVGAYAVTLLPSNIEVEIGATEHTSLYRVTYPAGQPHNVVVDLAHGLGGGETIASELTTLAQEVSGFVEHRGDMSGRYGGFKAYFVMRFDRPFSSVELLEAGERRAVTSLAGANVGAVLGFDPSGGPLNVQIGLSFIDLATATANLDAEWANFDLAGVQAQTAAIWERVLGRVVIEGGDAMERQKVFTALYHSYLMPTAMTEAGNKYRGVDGQIGTAEGWTYYSDFSLWDTFRTFHPLMSLIDKPLQRDFNRSLEVMADVSGRIPKWPLATGETNTMIGYHAETVLADSFQRGVDGFDVEGSYRRFRRAAVLPNERDEPSLRERDCAATYFESGWCAADFQEGSVSKTLENAFSDHVIAQLAMSLGKTDDAAKFGLRAKAYAQVMDIREGRARGRNLDGTFVDSSAELFASEFVEGNSWQWTTFVPHDVPGLAAAIGGKDRLLDFLDQFFEGTAATEDGPLPDLYYWHGNEPDIHAAYLYAELDQRDEMARWVDWIRRTRYNDGPSGLDGNDDGGTLSAWLVLSAFGLYPKVGEPRWILGTPLFPKVTLPVGDGAILTIVAENWRSGGFLVDEVRFNDERIDGPFIDHAKVAAGGTLTFVMRP